MENKKIDCKLILECSKQGVVKQIILDTGSLLKDIELPAGLHSLISPISLKDLGSFWLSIQENSMEENTLLNMNIKDNPTPLMFSGYLLKETVLLCGKTELTSREKTLEGIKEINNEQANHIRLAEKKVVNFQKLVDKNELNEDFLNDFTSLNNELINNKRELMRKNLKIESLNKELSAVNKELNDVNENMSMFTYSVSHDLKEPVRMIESFLSLLDKKYRESLDQKGQAYIDFALDGANRLSKMMTDLLEYHQSSDVSSRVDLNDVFLEVKNILKKKIQEKNAEVTSQKLPTLNGSPAGFLQIFQNLISNAIKFVPEDRTPIISIGLEEDDMHYTFMVKDNGIGIAENQRQDVFNLFKRLNAPQKYEGSGMGLAMVKKSIERMGGKVWMESEVDKGTTVFFTINKYSES